MPYCTICTYTFHNIITQEKYLDLYFTIAKCSVIIVGVYLLTQTNKYTNVCS